MKLNFTKIICFFIVKIRNKVEDGLVKSRLPATHHEKVQGSIYKMIEKRVLEVIGRKGDFLFLRNGVTLEPITALQTMTRVRK